MSYTPRQMYFMLELVRKRKAREQAAELNLMALATQGKPKAIREAVKGLQKESR